MKEAENVQALYIYVCNIIVEYKFSRFKTTAYWQLLVLAISFLQTITAKRKVETTQNYVATVHKLKQTL